MVNHATEVDAASRISTMSRHKLKSMKTHLTLNPLTTTFFLVGLVHCIAQGVLQSFKLTSPFPSSSSSTPGGLPGGGDISYSRFLDTVITSANVSVPKANHTNLLGVGFGGRVEDGVRLEMCDFIPHSEGSCGIVYELPATTSGILSSKKRGQALSPTPDSVNFSSNPVDPSSIRLKASQQCIGTLLYPAQHLQNLRREDITLLALQIWLFGISILAMCYDSVPHVLALLGVRILLTAWSIYTVWRTSFQQNMFRMLIEAPGSPCEITIFPEYFRMRIRYEISDLILNCTALGLAVYLSWALIKIFRAQSVRTVGASQQIVRMYKYFLAVQVCLQLETFSLMAWMGLWLDQIDNSYIRYITSHLTIYRIGFIGYTVLLVPWLLTGWWGIRLEKRRMTVIFILLGFIFTATASLMFYSAVFRWTFYSWPFFGCFTVTSLLLLVATFFLSIVCWRNFGRGLAHYLYAESALAHSNFTTGVFDHNIKDEGCRSQTRLKNPKLKSKMALIPDSESGVGRQARGGVALYRFYNFSMYEDDEEPSSDEESDSEAEAEAVSLVSNDSRSPRVIDAREVLDSQSPRRDLECIGLAL